MVADSLTRTEHNSNKELIGQGLGNVMSGLFGGLPGAGATMGTVVNIQAGGRSALSGIIRALILMLVILLFAGAASAIPLAVLAGIALKVGFDIIDWSFLQRAHHLSIKAACITYGVIALTVLVDLIWAVFIGVFVANVLTIERMTALQARGEDVSTTDDDVELPPDQQELLDQASGRLLLFQLTGPMIFGVAKTISREHNAIEECEAVLFDLTEVSPGVTASLALENAIKEAVEVGRSVYLVVMKGATRNRLEKLKLLELLPESTSAKIVKDSPLSRRRAAFTSGGLTLVQVPSSLVLRRPDGWHVHLRDGAMLQAVLPATAEPLPGHRDAQFATSITTVDAALAYRSRILSALPHGLQFEPLMTAYLTDDLDPDELERGFCEECSPRRSSIPPMPPPIRRPVW